MILKTAVIFSISGVAGMISKIATNDRHPTIMLTSVFMRRLHLVTDEMPHEDRENMTRQRRNGTTTVVIVNDNGDHDK